MAALVYRARDLGKPPHTFRRAYMQINQFGWRKNEPNEPDIEWPRLFARALDMLAEDNIRLDVIAKELSVNEADLCTWIYAGRNSSC